MLKHIDKQFNEAQYQWNLTKIYQDLSSIKGSPLTPVEKSHLRGLLCGYSPTEIADKLHKNAKGIEVSLSKTVYQYVKTIFSKVKVKNWRNIYEWFEQAGYKTPLSTPQVKNSIPLEFQIQSVKTCEINCDKITFELNIRIAMPLLKEK